MNVKHLILILVLGQAVSLYGQRMDSLEREISFYSDALTNLSSAEHRLTAAQTFRHKLIESLSVDGSFDYPFDALEWCQIVIPTDSSFRLITWQLEMGDNVFKYFGIVQKSDGSITELYDKRPLRSEYAKFDQNTWYGSLYYGVEEFKDESGQSKYLILGYSIASGKSNKKVADVMTLDGEGIQFGSEVFLVPEESGGQDEKSRIILDYASSASGRMQFDREKSMLIYDHVILINAGFEGPLWVPDGSFHGFEYADGKWHFIDKVFQTTVDRPPGDGVEKDGRDIIGRKKN